MANLQRFEGADQQQDTGPEHGRFSQMVEGGVSAIRGGLNRIGTLMRHPVDAAQGLARKAVVAALIAGAAVGGVHSDVEAAVKPKKNGKGSAISGGGPNDKPAQAPKGSRTVTGNGGGTARPPSMDPSVGGAGTTSQQSSGIGKNGAAPHVAKNAVQTGKMQEQEKNIAQEAVSKEGGQMNGISRQSIVEKAEADGGIVLQFEVNEKGNQISIQVPPDVLAKTGLRLNPAEVANRKFGRRFQQKRDIKTKGNVQANRWVQDIFFLPAEVADSLNIFISGISGFDSESAVVVLYPVGQNRCLFVSMKTSEGSGNRRFSVLANSQLRIPNSSYSEGVIDPRAEKAMAAGLHRKNSGNLGPNPCVRIAEAVESADPTMRETSGYFGQKIENGRFFRWGYHSLNQSVDSAGNPIQVDAAGMRYAGPAVQEFVPCITNRNAVPKFVTPLGASVSFKDYNNFTSGNALAVDSFIAGAVEPAPNNRSIKIAGLNQ